MFGRRCRTNLFHIIQRIGASAHVFARTRRLSTVFRAPLPLRIRPKMCRFYFTGQLVIACFLFRFQCIPPFAQYFAHRPIVLVRMLFVDERSMTFREDHERVHRSPDFRFFLFRGRTRRFFGTCLLQCRTARLRATLGCRQRFRRTLHHDWAILDHNVADHQLVFARLTVIVGAVGIATIAVHNRNCDRIRCC